MADSLSAISGPAERVRASAVWSWLGARMVAWEAQAPGLALPPRRIVDELHQDCCGISDIGLVRDQNEDGFLAVPEWGMYIVADGLGGHPAGEVASSIAVTEAFERLAGNGAEPVEHRLDAAFEAANEAIRRDADRYRERRGMGTTLIAAVVSGDRVTIAHLGDVRGYLCRGEELTRLTTDHTAVGGLLRAGLIGEDEARRHPARNRLTQAVMGVSEVVADQTALDLLPGDCLLLCSDGLWEAVSDSELGEILAAPAPAAALAARLVDRALAAGGSDNITAVIYRHCARPPAAAGGGASRSCSD